MIIKNKTLGNPPPVFTLSGTGDGPISFSETKSGLPLGGADGFGGVGRIVGWLGGTGGLGGVGGETGGTGGFGGLPGGIP